jgi:hypothetical protein
MLFSIFVSRYKISKGTFSGNHHFSIYLNFGKIQSVFILYMLTIIVDVSSSARILFESTLKIISSDVKNDFLNYFVQNSMV